MKKILNILSQLESVLGQMLDTGISEPLIKLMNKLFRRARRWVRDRLKEQIGPVSPEMRKWIATAMILVQTAKAYILLRS